MIRLLSSFSFQVCLLAATMSLCACGQRDMVLPQGEITPNSNKISTVAKETSTITSSASNSAPSAMRKTGGPEKIKHGGGGPIIVIEDTHFKGSGAK